MICREVMTENPVCCLPNDLVSASARVMRREDVGAVPVINDEQQRQLIGIVTDRDLTIKVVAEARDPNHTLVQDVMTSTIVVCREREDLSSAIKAMEEHQIGPFRLSMTMAASWESSHGQMWQHDCRSRDRRLRCSKKFRGRRN